MTDRDDDVAQKLADLDARLREVETLQELTLRILSTTRPLDGVLEQFGATESQMRTCYQMLDEIAVRASGPEPDRPTFGYFVNQLGKILPKLRDDPEFVDLIIDTLRVERPAYRDLHAYMMANGWPQRPIA